MVPRWGESGGTRSALRAGRQNPCLRLSQPGRSPTWWGRRGTSNLSYRQGEREMSKTDGWDQSRVFLRKKKISTILNFQESCKNSTRNSHIPFTPIGHLFTFYPIYLSTLPLSSLDYFILPVNSPGYLIKLKPVLSSLIAPITNHTYLFAHLSSCFRPARMSAPRRQPCGCHCHTPTTVRAHEINS